MKLDNDTDRELLTARIRKETTKLLRDTNAHISMTLIVGADGGVSECSSSMSKMETAYFVERITVFARGVIKQINDGRLTARPPWSEDTTDDLPF